MDRNAIEELRKVDVPPALHLIDGVRVADKEKAFLDVLYFHLRGRVYPFDLYSDIRLEAFDSMRLREYLKRYRNPKFVAFAESFLSKLEEGAA